MKQNNINQLYALVEAEKYSEIRVLLEKLLEENKPLAVKFAVKCAYLVLDIYEKKYPGNDKPRKAIEAAEAWIANPTVENQEKAKNAASAASAAYAADAAAYAAYAAASAANAASAAYAAAYAAADAAANAAERKETWTKCIDIYANLSRKEKLSQSCFNC
jgi:hypothetical protein